LRRCRVTIILHNSAWIAVSCEACPGHGPEKPKLGVP
jgi:hypothetical protein